MTVTLETLRADFEAVATEFETTGVVSGSAKITVLTWKLSEPDFYIEYVGGYSGFINDAYTELVPRLLKAAHTYIVARDHSLNAAMLYKLSDGAIDPRRKDGADNG